MSDHWTRQLAELPKRPAWNPTLPVVSIITPNYNYGHFLETCMRSVLLQSYPNIEYIVVDGGSTDESRKLILEYEAFGISRWVSEPDDGQTDAINKGFAMSTGHLFAWLNSDDAYAHPRVIEEVVQHYLQGARFISGEWHAVDELGKPFPAGQPYGDLDPVDFHSCLRYWEHTCPTQPATFVDRDLAARVFPLDTSIECFMDYQLFLGVLAQDPTCAWVKERWVDFTFHGSNKSLGNYTAAYDLDRETRAVFLQAAKTHLPANAFRSYQREFEPVLIIRSAPGIPFRRIIRRTWHHCPGFFFRLAFWKAIARKAANRLRPANRPKAI